MTPRASTRVLKAVGENGVLQNAFRREIENAYRLVLCDPELERDTLRANRFVEALREGEELAGFGGWRSALLHVQRTHDGVMFLANLPSGTVLERGDASWVNAARKLLAEIIAAEDAGQDRTAAIAAAGHELWRALPERIQGLFSSPPPGGIALSLDPETGVLPLELMTPTGKPDDFLCLKMEMPRAPGEGLFRECLERRMIASGGEPRALVFGNPWHTDATHLALAEQQARRLASRLQGLGFSPTVDGKLVWAAADAWASKFLEGLSADPAIVHFTGHGTTVNQEECLLLAGDDRLSADALLRQAQKCLGHPLVFLDSCLTGRARGYGGALRGLPLAFLQLGAAAVVASVFVLSQGPAAAFADTFYEKLFAGETVGEAMLHTRQEMHAAGANCLHWGRPILYGNPHARLVLPRKV
jgi:hypothetical protein